jgi:hypothetical protein
LSSFRSVVVDVLVVEDEEEEVEEDPGGTSPFNGEVLSVIVKAVLSTSR